MIKLKNEFEHFTDAIKLTSEANDLITKRQTLQNNFKDNFPDKCKENGIELNKSDIRFIDQGSYKINTTIKNKNGSVDRDVAVIFPLDKNTHNDPRKLKKLAKDALLIENVRVPLIKEPCITVTYVKKEDEYLHIDFPLYATHNDKLYLARGKEFSAQYSWEEADPEGLNEYFLEKLKDNEQLRRIIRYIKKWKQEKYSGSTNDNEVPPSIALTLLASECFVELKEGDIYDDLGSLYYTINKIINKFRLTYEGEEVTKAEIMCNLPITPYSDVLYKMRNSDSHGVLFYNRLKKAEEKLRDAVNVESEHDAAQYVQKVLGDEFEVPEKKAMAAAIMTKKEHSFG